jgi:hypothetical protein
MTSMPLFHESFLEPVGSMPQKMHGRYFWPQEGQKPGHGQVSG